MTDYATCPTCGHPIETAEDTEAHLGLFRILARLPRDQRRIVLDRLMTLRDE